LKKHAAQAISLEGQVLELKSDHETQALAVHLAGIRTRIATLLSQAEHGRVAVTNARESHVRRQEELTQYQLLLTEIEVWLETARRTVEAVATPDTETQIGASIDDLDRLSDELDEKEARLQELASVCDEFKKYPDLRQLAEALVEQLRTLTVIFVEERTAIRTKIETLRVHLDRLRVKSPDLSQENTLDSASMPIEESPIVGVHIETQTGRSLASPQQQIVTRDFTVTYNEPVDVQIQTQLSDSASEVQEPGKHKETITISKTVADGAETIQIATKPMAESQPIVEEPDDLLVEANYRKQTQTRGESSELNITNAKPNQPFETVFVEPDETTTEVIVDADGTKRIIVKKLHRTVVRHQQTVQQQQHLTSTSTLTDGNQPVTQSFSQVSLKEQQSSTTVARGDGSRQTVTSKQYGGKIVSGVPGGEVDVQEFQTEPETQYTVVEGDKPSEVEIEGIRLHEGDVTFVDQENKLLPPYGGSQIHTSSSSVRAVVQQVTRRVIRKTRRIIRRIVIVDGKEQITEEVVEEPEEVEVTEEGIPRVSINVTRTEDGRVVEEQQFGEPTVVVEEPGTSVTQTVTAAVFDGKPIEALREVTEEGERYVVEQAIAPQPESTLETRRTETIASKDFIENERLALSSNVEDAPRAGDAPEDRQTPRDELPAPVSTDVVVETAIPEEVPKEAPTEALPPQTAEVATMVTPPADRSPKTEQQVEGASPPSPGKDIAVQMPSPKTEERVEEASPRRPSEEIAVQMPSPKVSQVIQTVTQTVTTPVVSIREVEKVTEEPEAGQPTTTIEIVEKTVTEPGEAVEEVDSTARIVEETVLKPLQVNGDVKQKDICVVTQDFITSQQFHEAEPPKVEILSKTESEESPDSPIGKKKKKKFSKSKKVSGTPRTQSPLVPGEEDAPKESQNVEIALSLEEQETAVTPKDDSPQPVEKPKKPSQEVEIALSLEEKAADSLIVSPQVSMSMLVEEKKMATTPAEMIQKDIHVTLPAVSHSTTAIVKSVALSPMAPQTGNEREESVAAASITPKLESEHVESPTPSDIDHGGRRSKKKKKHKEETPSEEIEEDKEGSIATSVAESTEIIMPDDSLPSEETPKPTEEVFEQETPKPAEVFEPVTESDEEEDGKDTGYEADKTTVDESLADDDNQEHKKRRRKKRKQKVKVKESEESNIPKSVYESSPFGDSVPLTDDEPVKVQPQKVEEPKKSKKRRKGKREESKHSESEHEIESEPAILEAQDEEIVSPNDSYHTLSTQSDLGTVKVVEEVFLRPSSESPQQITEKIVTTVPVLEAVITQETLAQTSPELNQVVQQFIEREQVATEPVSVQTSPEVPKETVVVSMQTSREPSPEVVKPEIQDTSSQVEVTTSEIVTQTETPEKVEVITSETSIQTATPEQVEVVEEAAQTISPETVDIPRSESAMQTTIVSSQEEFVQTQSPELQVSESAVQAQPTPAEHSVQTSPEPSAPPFEEVFAEEIAEVGATKEIPEVEAAKEVLALVPPKEVPETSETVTQTSPVVVHDINELTPPSSLSEQYEVLVEASVTVPSESTDTVSEKVSTRRVKEEEEVKPTEESVSEESSPSDVDVEVYVDGEPVRKPRRRRRHRKAKKEAPKEAAPGIEKDLLAAFKRKEDGGLLDPKELYSEVAKKHSRSSSPAPPEEVEEEAVVVSKVITDLDQEKVKKLAAKPKPKEDREYNISVEIVPTETPSTSPEDFEIISEDVVTQQPTEGDFQVTTSVKVVQPEDGTTEFTSRESVFMDKSKMPKSSVTDFIAGERAAAEPAPKMSSPADKDVKKEEKVEPDSSTPVSKIVESVVKTETGREEVKPSEEKLETKKPVEEVKQKEPKKEELKPAGVTDSAEPAPVEKTAIEVPKSAGKVEVKEVSEPSEETKVESAAETLPETTVDTKVTELKWVEETRAEGPAAVGDTKTKESKSIQEVEEKPVEETMERPKPVEESRIGEPKFVEEIKLEGPKPVEDVQVARPVEEVKIEKDKSVEEARSRPETEPRLETVTVPEVVEKAKEPEALQQTATQHDVPFEESKITTVIQEPGKLDKKQFLPTDLLEEEIQIPKTKSPSPKPKHKHVSSVTIEEVESSGLPEDLPVSSTPKPTWQKRQQASALFIEGERQQSPVAAQDLDIRWAHTQALERVKNLQNARKTTHLSDVLYLATLHEVITDESVEQRSYNVQENLNALKDAVEKRDVVVIQQTIITTVETITTWLETIEYRIYVNRQQTADGPSKERVQQFNNLKEEIVKIEDKVEQLQSVMKQADDIYNEDDRKRMKSYIDSLQQQVRVIEEVTSENEQLAASDLRRWEEFIRGVGELANLIDEVRKQLDDLKESDASPQTKLNELDKIEHANRCNMLKAVHLIATAKGLMRDFPTREIPKAVYSNHDSTKSMEQQIVVEREKALQFLSLADEYEQTLKEFGQIIDVAEALVESPINVSSLEHLEDAMQNHRKFFVNLSHCRAILESLEENLDSETRMHHSELHRDLYDRAKVILDQATGRFQQMSLAASRWTVLEQGMREEMRWLQVAQQRVPDLSDVTSSDYDRYIDLYQSLALDIAHHQAKITHLNGVAQKLQELVVCSGLEEAYMESLEIILKLQDDVQNNLKRLLAFRDLWTSYNLLSDRVEYWLRDAEQQLQRLEVPSGPRGHMRQFWELKAQHEVHNSTRQEATNNLEKSLQVVPISDEMIQRKFHTELQDQWNTISKRINDIQTTIIGTISATDVPVNEKLALLEQELEDLKVDVDNLRGIIKTEEELNLYIERLQVMSTRIDTIQNELGRLGLLSATESDKVGSLLALSKRLEILISEELEGGTLLKERLQNIQRGIDRVRRKHSSLSETLDQCEKSEKLGSEAVEKAVNDCYEVGEELVTLWQDLMGLRQLLHTLPMRLRVTVSPVKVERDISHLQDAHTVLEKRCGQLLALLRNRLALWQRFEHQLELVQQSVQEADFMMELLTVQGTVDYERLRKATERLESVSVDLVSRETLVAELQAAAKPLSDSCTPEISAKVEAAVEEAVTAYSTTCTNLKELCTKYQQAADLWKRYRDASDLVSEWVDNHMESVANLEPEEAIKAVKVCEETLSAHTERLAELKELVSGIAAAVGLDASALLGGEVEALGKRLEDVRESLTALADVAEARAVSREETTNEINGTRTYLDSVQRCVDNIEQSPDTDSEEKLLTLREHLLALSKAEGQIQKIKDKTLEMTQSTRTETSVIEILELWQQVFRETFQQYHRLSTRLIKNEDGAAALKLWQEYLLNVQQFLQGSIPGDYHSLSEHQHLCQVHQNLLTTQQNVLKPLDKKESQLGSGLVESSVMEQFNSLTNLHNETLSRIMERHKEVQTRLNAWDDYKQDQNKLLIWLKNIEKDREKMQLKYIHIRRIPKLLSRIQTLLGKIPQGEEQTDSLQKQQNLLLQFCDDALATSIRMEHAAIKQRISNLQAGLETWRQFLERITLLLKTHEENVEKVQTLYDDIQDIITVSAGQLPTSHSGVSNKLEALQRARARLSNATKDLEQLGLTQEQLKECISPGDIKTINQRMWILWHQQGDLDHQLAVLVHQLEEKLGLRSMFETRQSRFVAWADEIERRLDEDSEGSISSIKDPQEMLRRLETELQAEMSLKEREYNWLVTTGRDLVANCGEEYSDVTAKQIIQAKTDVVLDRWERLDNIGKTRRNKIHDMMQTMSQLEQRIAEIRAWLTQIESQLGKPLVFEASTKDVIERKLQEHEKLKKSIENESGNIGEVLNLCELLLSDADVWKAHFSTENITVAIQNLEKRWKAVCGQSAERKRKINFIWKLLQEVLRLSTEQEPWLTEKEHKIKDLDKPVKKLNREEIQELIYMAENQLKDVESRTPTFEILEQTYSKLATLGGLEPENIQELTSRARVVITRWYNLLPRVQSLVQRLKNEIVLFKEFSLAHEDAIIGLTKVDAQLTELEHLTTQNVRPRDRLNELELLEQHLALQNPVLETADKLGLEIMKKVKKNEVVKYQEMIDEYQILWKDVQQRIITLKTTLKKEIVQQPREVDEGVQVETLKFQQDSAVQVDTLPALQRMTSISAKDAYLMELTSGISECRGNIDGLEELLAKEIPQQGSAELPISAKKIARVSATCQSTVELVKHLHDLLINECDATEEEALGKEVYELIRRFETLLLVAKDKEQKIRELRSTISDAYKLSCNHEAGRLLCPLCTKRNWAQLDNDLWRLEKWLQVAEGTQKTQRSPPSNIEQLEDVIQDHREFLLDLDSHKSIVRSLNIVGTHLADHTEDTERADQLRARLDTDNKRWEAVCKNAASWETLLQTALMDNQQFHTIITEMCVWLEKTEQRIRVSEPVDLTADRETIETKYQNFRELRAELERCEPRVMSLQEAANQLLRHEAAPEGSSTTCTRLTELRLKLQSLIRLTGVYILKLGAVLGRDPNEMGAAVVASNSVSAPLHTLNYDVSLTNRCVIL
jgi:nesprin-1